MTEIVGIDLGTTNSLIGIFDAGFPILFSNEAGSRLTPSAVYFPQEGEPVIGAAALRMRSLDPANTIVSVKRLMGSRPGENAHSPANTEAKDARGRLTIEAGGKPRTPVEVSAHILRELKKLAEHSLGHAVERAVITVPAYFNDAQRNATKQAGELAGFRVERILAEPTAAALAYGLDRLKEKARIAVFDLGGGTFDISILEMHDGLFEVISTNGNTRLGGDDMDAALADHLAKELGLEKPSLEIRMRLSEAARSAKEALSENETTTIHLPFLTAGSSSTLTVTRATLEHLCRPIIARTESHCRRSLADAKISTKELDAVILVGGATRMPLVREFVAGLFDRTPDVSQHPDEAVAKGAIIQAGMLEGKLENLTLLDITPLSLGIETFGGLMNVLIPRNSTIPCKAGEMFTNVAANQQSMRLRILQGERELAADNWPLGEMEVPFQPAPKGQARVGVQFEIDANGILHVLARDIATGQDKELTIQSAVDVTDDAVEKMLEDSLEHAFEDMSERIFVEAKIKAEEMLPAVEMGLHHVGHRLSSDEKAKIEQCVEKVRSALLSHETVNLKSALAELDALTQELATLLLEELS